MSVARCHTPDMAQWASGSPSHTGLGRAAREFALVGRAVPSTDGLRVLPVKRSFVLWELVRGGKLVPCAADPRHPFAEGKLQLAIHQIRHVHSSIRNVIFDVI